MFHSFVAESLGGDCLVESCSTTKSAICIDSAASKSGKWGGDLLLLLLVVLLLFIYDTTSAKNYYNVQMLKKAIRMVELMKKNEIV